MRGANFILGLAGLLLGLAGCSRDDRFPPYDNSAEVDAYFKAHPDFYVFKTSADLPSGLVWEDGASLPDLGDTRAKKGGTYHYFDTSFPPTLRHVGPEASSSFRQEHWENTMTNLVLKHPNVDGWVPGVAEKWSVAPDRQTVYFKIDPAATFSDGVKITTDDFLMTFYVSNSPHVQDPYQNDYFKKEFASFTKYDDQTFAIKLTGPKPDPLWKLYDTQPSERKFWREFGPDYAERYQWRKDPTTGPYEIYPDGVKFGRSITLNRVKNWWARDKKFYRNRFNFDYIEFKFIGSMDKAWEVFRQGQLDSFDFRILNLPKYWYDRCDIPEVHNGYIEKTQFYNIYPIITRGIWLNCSKPGLDNADVRRGLQHAFNIQKVIDIDFRGDLERMNTSAPGLGKYENPNIKAREYDTAKAREYFTKAGYTVAGGDGILANAAGQRLSFTLGNPNPAFNQLLLRLVQDAKKAGVEIKLENADMTLIFKKASDEKTHEMTIMGFGAQPPYPDPHQNFHSVNAWKTGPDGKKQVVTNSNNICMIADPELDRLIDAQRSATTEDDIQKLSWQVQEKVHDLACVIPCWQTPYIRSVHWRWLRWPEDNNVKGTQEPRQFYVEWIDEDLKKETLEAMRSGKAFPEVEHVYDQYRVK